MYLIGKEFTFDAAHYLRAEDQQATEKLYGKCAKMHGHTYKLHVQLIADKIPSTGMIINFANLKQLVQQNIIEKYDHSVLNETTGIKIPTAENLVEEIFNDLKVYNTNDIRLYSVKLWETPTSWAEKRIKNENL